MPTTHEYKCNLCGTVYTVAVLEDRGISSEECARYGCTGKLRKVFVPEPDLSVDDEKMDALIESASTPNLAALFRQGKQAGTIQPVQAYGFTRA